jgi:hypothetical protein
VAETVVDRAQQTFSLESSHDYTISRNIPWAAPHGVETPLKLRPLHIVHGNLLCLHQTHTTTQNGGQHHFKLDFCSTFTEKTMNDSYYYGIEEKTFVCGSAKTWRCILCGLPIESEELRRRHAQDTRHKQEVEKALTKFSMEYDRKAGATILRRNTSVIDLEIGADRLQSLHWQLHVQGILYRYMRLDMTSLVSDEASLLKQAKTLLQKYEQMERLSLLELAVWKAACVSRSTRVDLDSKMSMKSVEDAVLCVANNHHTWKEYRTETRRSNAIEIIIKHVLPFLGKP